MIHRRSFITGLISLVAAPAIVRAGSLMPVKEIGLDFGLEPFATYPIVAEWMRRYAMLRAFREECERSMMLDANFIMREIPFVTGLNETNR